MVVTVSGDEDVGEVSEDEVEELVVKTRDNEWYIVLSLGKLCEELGFCYHWTSGQKPHLIKNGRKINCNTANCWCIFKKHYRHEKIQFSDVYRCLFFCWHIAVGCHHRRRIFRYPHGFQFGKDHVHACSGIHHKLSLLGFYCGCGQQNPLPVKRTECSFVFLFELRDILGKFPRISTGASLLSCSLFCRYVLELHVHSVGTSLMKNFDLYITKRWTSIFADVCLTQCSSRESRSSNWSRHLCALPRNRCRF